MRMERRKIPPYRLQEPSLVPLVALGLASCGGGGGSVKEKEEEEEDDDDGGVTFPADQKFGVRIFVL